MRERLLGTIPGIDWLRRSPTLRAVRELLPRSAPPPSLYDSIRKEAPCVTELVATTKNGTFMLSLRDQVLSKAIVSTGEWESYELSVLQRMLSPGDLAIDIGANLGWHATCMTRSVGPNGHVVAFEPEPYNFSLLTRNLYLNGLSEHCTTLNFAVSNVAGSLRFELSQENFGDHRVREQAPGNDGNDYGENTRSVTLVESLRLDDALDAGLFGATATRLFAERGVRLLKMDTQGSELRILQGAGKVLERADAVITEFWPYGLTRMNSSPGEFLETLFRHFEHAQVLWASPGVALAPLQRASLAELQRVAAGLNSQQNLDLLFSKTPL